MIFAISMAAPAIPIKPKNAAITATTKNINAHLNIITSPFQSKQIFFVNLYPIIAGCLPIEFIPKISCLYQSFFYCTMILSVDQIKYTLITPGGQNVY